MVKEFALTDPLFNVLRSRVLWHSTSLSNYRSIIAEGVIRPTSGTTSRWGNRPYACQVLGAVCLFDFATPTEDLVLEISDRWSGFLGSVDPVTVLIGLTPGRLPGRLIRYPENRDITPEDSCGPIPQVEVCHVGEIPIAASETHLLICSEDHRRFWQAREVSHSLLSEIVPECERVAKSVSEAQIQSMEILNARIAELKAQRHPKSP